VDTHKEDTAVEARSVLAADEVDIFKYGVRGWGQERIEWNVRVEDDGVGVNPADGLLVLKL
jgi:hypothetical protein